MNPTDVLRTMIGTWEGISRTWNEPEKLGDESTVQGEIEWVLEDQGIRHLYQGSMKGKPRQGEETIAYSSARQVFQVAWMDSYHMSDGFMISEGPVQEQGFSVTGSYDAGPGNPPWGWRTDYRLSDADHLVITAFNISPDGEEAKAVETVYARVPG